MLVTKRMIDKTGRRLALAAAVAVFAAPAAAATLCVSGEDVRAPTGAASRLWRA
jgi:hypothetical protein